MGASPGKPVDGALTVMHVADVWRSIRLAPSPAGLSSPTLAFDLEAIADGLKRAALDAHDLLAPIATAPDALLDWCPEERD